MFTLIAVNLIAILIVATNRAIKSLSNFLTYRYLACMQASSRYLYHATLLARMPNNLARTV